jgi:hypothetical protein
LIVILPALFKLTVPLDNKVLVNTLIPVNPKDKWFNYAISDEALFHATMLHSAGHNAMLAGNNDLADPFQLKLEAIRLVNRRLDDPVRSISDLTIGAVACLVLFEVSSTPALGLLEYT